MISLLWNKTKEISEVNECIFTDLKITKLLENIFDTYTEVDDLLEVMKYIPDSETIEYRQEVLTDIFNDSENEFTKIYHELARIGGLYFNLKNSNELIKRQILLLVYLNNYFEFLEYVYNAFTKLDVKSSCLNNIKNKIKEYFENKETRKLVETVKSIYVDIAPKLNFSATYKDGAPYVQIEFEKKQTLEDDLLNIMDSFNIKRTKLPKASSHKEVNLMFLKEVVLEHIDLFKPIKEIYEKYYTDESFDLRPLQKELRFYLNVKQLFDVLRKKDIKVSKVKISNEKTVINNAYDVTLTISNKTIIPNDFIINRNQNVIFLLGVNSGGKTCYLRSAALSYFFLLITGYSFCESAEIEPVDYFYTHFPNEENYGVGEGRLKDEINRINSMKETFGEKTICFCNETFSSTSEEKACNLTYELLNDLLSTNTKMLFVTHQYQIFEKIHNEKVVYLAPEIDEADNNRRTHKIKKVEKNLLSYANDILVKHGLSKKDLEEKVKRLSNE